MNHLKDITVSYDRDKILTELHLQKYENREKLLDDILKECHNLIDPRIAYDSFRVKEVFRNSLILENGIELHCSTLSEKGCFETGLIPYIITIGDKLETKISHLGSKNILHSYLLDKLGTYALRQIRRHFEDFIFKEKGYTVSSFTPGDMVTWRIEEVAKIFKLLGEANVKEKIGVILTENFLMIPKKSICGVMAQTSEKFVKCQMCTMKCEYRNIHFQESIDTRK